MTGFKWPRIDYDEAVAVIGPKGSGKSELVANLLCTKHNAIVFDTKRIEHWESVGEILRADNDVWRIRSGRFVWRVPPTFIDDDDGGKASKHEQSRMFQALLNTRGPRVVAIDEAYNYKDSLGLKLLATQGRASRVPLWVAMQRPTGVPLYTLSEADHFFIFSLLLKDDRKRIEEATGGASIPWDELANTPHGFVHFRPGGKMSPVTFLKPEAMLLDP